MDETAAFSFDFGVGEASNVRFLLRFISSLHGAGVKLLVPVTNSFQFILIKNGQKLVEILTF